MTALVRVCVVAVFTAVMVALAATPARADRRVALIVGNAQYAAPSLLLSNPKNDADDVAAVLRTLGFDVILKTDSNKRDLELAMAQFARLSTNADVALFFYAGHALQYQGRNYLMPVDSTLEDEISLRYQMVAIDDVRAALDRARGVKIMILDACRNNPLADTFKRKISGASRSIETVRGLARIDKAEGTIVAYATAPDEVATDGSGRNSPYTTALLKHLQEPGLEIEIMFRRIAADVSAQTNGRQRPETHVSLLNEYHLNQQDQQTWDKIKDARDPAVFDDFVRRYPSSMLVADALARERRLENEAADRVAKTREEDQRRAQAAAAAERQRAENEAAQRRAQDEQRRAQAAAAAAAAERQRAESEAAQRRAQEEQRRAQEEQRRVAEEQRLKLAGLERERVEAANAQRLRDEALRRQQAETERRKLEQQATLARVAPPPEPQDLACKRETEQLARLRASQDGDEVIRFERALTCAKLRPQVLRLRESLVGTEGTASRSTEVSQSRPVTTEPSSQASALPPQTERRGATEGQRLPSEARLQPAPSPVSPEEACRRDGETLARLRISQSREEIIRFARELACERLRPQVLRLRESVAAD
jgi:uncharacterized caspase-like protein